MESLENVGNFPTEGDDEFNPVGTYCQRLLLNLIVFLPQARSTSLWCSVGFDHC